MIHGKTTLQVVFSSHKTMITSRTNPSIKAVRALQQAKQRNESGLHLLEGDKLVWDAVQSGVTLKAVYCIEGTPVPDGIEPVLVSESVLEAISTVKTPQRMVAVAKTPDLSCPNRYPSGLILALDCVQDPGNLGTILRTADALGASALLLSPDTVDPFSPKALRAAMGSTYHLPLYVGDLPTELTRLSKQGFSLVCGHLHGSETPPAHKHDTVLVVGNEGNGVSDSVSALCYRYRMPMRGRAESLNVAVFSALMMQQYFLSE